MNNQYPKLFVVGCPRSGTSWVTTLLSSHPEVVMVPAETHAYRLIYEPFIKLPKWDFRQRQRAWKGLLLRYGPKPLLLGFGPSDIWRGILRDYQILNRPNSHGLHVLADYSELKLLMKGVRTHFEAGPEAAEQLISALFDRFFQQHGSLNQTLLEKTPMHLDYGDRILCRFPEARIIEVIRDGRDVCASYNALATQQAWARIGTAGAIRQWKQCIDRGEKLRAQRELTDRIHVVRYESLKANPVGNLQQMFDFANLSWTPSQLHDITQAADIHQIREKGEGQYVRKGIVGDWKNKLSKAEVRCCENIAGKQLARLGYV